MIFGRLIRIQKCTCEREKLVPMTQKGTQRTLQRV